MALSCHAGAQDVDVAVASNFAAIMQDIKGRFEKNSPYQVRLSFGSSGKIFAQIQHGAPFDMFLSADQAKPEALEELGLGVKGSRFTYAVGGLALWSSETGITPTDLEAMLKGAKMNKLALANPKLAPYGVAAAQVLEQLDIKALTEPNWVMGENIAQTYQFVATGNAKLGFVALSQVLQDNKVKTGSAWIIPQTLYYPIRQQAVLLQRGRENMAANALLNYLKSAEAREIITSYGYTTE